MHYTRRFTELSSKDTAIAGGKGASLGELTRAGIPVPDGFVILTSAFQRALDSAGIQNDIVTVLQALNPEDVSAVRVASEHLQARIAGLTMPDDVMLEITQSLALLKSDLVAVRSSATVEDGASSAWAGQLESYLNVEHSDVAEYVKRCWSSLFTQRALVYRFAKGYNEQHIDIAVVIQHMVASDVSGVAFSAHPVTHDKNRIVIEACYGLGESLVSGQVTPDNFIVEKDTGRLIAHNAHRQTKKLALHNGDTSWVELSSAERTLRTLTDSQVIDLVGTIVAIEKHYGFPVDVEWTYADGIFSIVQSRPITTIAHQSRISRFRREEYMLSFWVKGVSVFITDMTREAFAAFEVLYILDDGTYKQYFTLRAYERSLAEGVVFYGDAQAFANYVQSFRALSDEFAKFYLAVVKDKSHVERETFERCCQYFIDLSRLYSRMNCEYTDRAFMLRDSNPIIRESLAKITTFKDEMRIFLNTVLFEPDSYVSRLFTVLGRQFGIDPSMLENLTQRELLGLYDGASIDEARVSVRQHAYACTYDSPDPIEGNDAEELLSRFEERAERTDAITGQTASEGRMTGIVKIISVDYSDFTRVTAAMETMQQGAVLVAETTAPELMAACKKAGAIVTDMGGLMSHGAIVSREFGIPCVVGTQNASKILKDGDMVEVDATAGVVRVLKRFSEQKN